MKTGSLKRVVFAIDISHPNIVTARVIPVLTCDACLALASHGIFRCVATWIRRVLNGANSSAEGYQCRGCMVLAHWMCIVKMNVLLLMGHPTREKFIKNSSTTSSAIRKLHTIAPPSPSRDVKISVKKIPGPAS